MAGPRNVRTLHGNGGRNNDVMGPKEFWLNIPPITRTLFTLAIVMTIVGPVESNKSVVLYLCLEFDVQEGSDMETSYFLCNAFVSCHACANGTI